MMVMMIQGWLGRCNWPAPVPSRHQQQVTSSLPRQLTSLPPPPALGRCHTAAAWFLEGK